MKKQVGYLFQFFLIVSLLSCVTTPSSEDNFNMSNVIPWCIVPYDALERSPLERIQMLKEMGFDKYAYDWRDRHLDEMGEELKLAQSNGIEVASV
jgi:hypothetical protein